MDWTDRQTQGVEPQSCSGVTNTSSPRRAQSCAGVVAGSDAGEKIVPAYWPFLARFGWALTAPQPASQSINQSNHDAHANTLHENGASPTAYLHSSYLASDAGILALM